MPSMECMYSTRPELSSFITAFWLRNFVKNELTSWGSVAELLNSPAGAIHFGLVVASCDCHVATIFAEQVVATAAWLLKTLVVYVWTMYI